MLYFNTNVGATLKRTLDGEDRAGIIQGEGKGDIPRCSDLSGFRAFPQG